MIHLCDLNNFLLIKIYSGSRVIVTAARLGFFLKCSNKLETFHGCYETPIYALLAQCIWCMLIMLFVGSGFTITSFELFSRSSIYSFWIFYLFAGLGLLVHKEFFSKIFFLFSKCLFFLTFKNYGLY